MDFLNEFSNLIHFVLIQSNNIGMEHTAILNEYAQNE